MPLLIAADADMIATCSSSRQFSPQEMADLFLSVVSRFWCRSRCRVSKT